MTKQLNYKYDPTTPQLVIYEGTRMMGGFIGEQAEKQFKKILETGAKIEFMNTTDHKRKQKVQQLRATWISQGIDTLRGQIIERFDVTSTADLTEQQLDELLHEFSAKYQQEPTAEVRRMRSEVMTLLTRYGTYRTDDDWVRVNRFLLDKRIAGKLLFQLSIPEMQALKRKLHKLIADKERKENEVKRQIMMN